MTTAKPSDLDNSVIQFDLFAHADINCWMRCGSSPSQAGFWAVLSKIDEVSNLCNKLISI